MATQNLLLNATADGPGTAVQLSGPATYQLVGTSSIGGAIVKLEYNFGADTDAEYSVVAKLGNIGNDTAGKNIEIFGDYYLRAVVLNASPDTSITVKVSQ